MSNLIVKNLNFGDEGREKVFKGITKLTQAVSSTLGASGKCVLLEDSQGYPVITKDGVTVANSVILLSLTPIFSRLSGISKVSRI